MTRDPDRVACSDTLVEVARRMRNLLVAFLPVCYQHGDLQGVIALRDLKQGGDPARVTASSLAQLPPITIGVDDPIGHVVSDLMAAHRMWLLPVLDGPRLVGVIHYATGGSRVAGHFPVTPRVPRGVTGIRPRRLNEQLPGSNRVGVDT